MILNILAKNTITMTLYIVLGVALLCAVIFTISLFTREKRYRTYLQSHSNNARIIFVNLKNETVRYFDRTKLKTQKLVSIEMFLDQFLLSERALVREWLFNLISVKDKTPKYLEVDVQINYNKKVFFSFLQVQKINYKNKTIHLESYLMKYLVPQNRNSNRSKRITTLNQVQEIINKEKYPKHYNAFLIRFYHARLQVGLTKQVENLLLTQLKNSLSLFLNQQRYMIDLTDSSIVILDGRAMSRRDILQLAHSIEKQLSQYINLNALRDTYKYSIGVCDASKNKGPLNNLIKKARAASIVADNTRDHICVYDDEMLTEKNSIDSFTQEIAHIIKRKELKYKFRPIINAKKGAVIGYFTSVLSSNAIFNNIDEIKEYSLKIGQNKELFSHISKNVIPRYLSEREHSRTKLFYGIAVAEIKLIARILTHINDVKSAKIVLVLDEEELYIWQNDVSVTKEINDLTTKDFEVALSLKNKNFLLPENIMQLFDFFIIDGELSGGIKKNTRMRLAIHSLVEKLESYKKTIIVNDITNWNGLELMLKSGIVHVSSDVISGTTETIVPVDKKKMTKLKSMAESNKY